MRPPRERADRALDGLLHHRGPGTRVGPELGQPTTDLGHLTRRQQPVVGERGLVHREERRVLQPTGGEHPGEVGRDRSDGVGRRPVEHDRHRGGPLRRLAQEAPRHLVGVPRCGGHEEPQVRRGEELGRQVSVALLDGVDVGSVEDGEALGHHVEGDELQGLGVVRRVMDPLELGQQPVGAEPVAVGGVVHQDRRTGRRTEHAGLGHDRTDEGVDQRGLAGAGRAADHREQRRLEGDDAWDDVVLELVDHLGPGEAMVLDARQLERQHGALQRRTQAHEGRDHLRTTRGVGHRMGTTCPGNAIDGLVSLMRAT